MKFPNWVTEIVADFEKRTKPFMEVEIHDALALRSKSEDIQSQEDLDGFRAEACAFFFYERRSKDSIWGTYFAPMFSATHTNGEKIVAPNVKDLNADIVAYWEKRAKECSNPVMRARYADVVWDLSNAIAGARANAEFARIAIDAYLEATDRNFFTPEVAGIQWLQRALDLAQSIHDPERTKRVVDFNV
jgi:lysyl-tRNA synthetase class 1